MDKSLNKCINEFDGSFSFGWIALIRGDIATNAKSAS